MNKSIISMLSLGSKSKKMPKLSNSNTVLKNLSGLPIHVVDGITNVVNNVTDYLKVAEQENTKRTDITAKRDVALAAIRAQRETLSELMKYTFQERAVVIQKHFEILDQAMASGNTGVIDMSLKSMVQVIQTSPFKTIQEMQQALENKDFVIRLE